ncbi:hypothetical protein GOP47_0026956 [Adiantum capillus-veneris]|nr:hypothetical protein GOP47_0026956 [Adiantum capillus-veneris]
MESSALTEVHRNCSKEREDCISSPGHKQHWQDDVALGALLKACTRQNDICRGFQLHAHIVKKALLQLNVFIGNALVHMYATSGALGKALQVFDDLLFRSVVSWNTLMVGYVHYGHNVEALECFLYMQDEGLTPDRFTFACMLSACGSIRAVEMGKDLHTEIVMNRLLENDTILGNALVNMYGKCGALDEAQNVFDKLPLRNEVSWTALITGFCLYRYNEETLKCFALMKHEGLVPDAVTFACILKACASIGSYEEGEAIHATILREGLLVNRSMIAIALVDMYAKCDAIPSAHFLLNEHCVQDIVSWNSLIVGCCQNGHGEDALDFFEQMEIAGLSPDAVTYACILKACASIGAAERGREMHAEIVRREFLQNDAVLGNALVDMYVKCGALASAQEIFDKLFVRDVATWTALLVGYYEAGNVEYALKCFERMKKEGLFPDAVTLSCILKACGSIGAIAKGRQVHAEIIRRALLKNACGVESALLEMYVSCGALSKAQLVLDEIPFPDVVSWNVLIAGYHQHGRGKDSIVCFEIMNCPPDSATYASVLKACGSIGALEKASEIHSEIIREGFLSKCSMLGSALIDTYAKCGVLGKAQEVFDRLPVRDIVCWTTLITAYSEHGDGERAFMYFERMIHEGLYPDAVTFSCIIKACSNMGEAEKGAFYFESMGSNYEINPSLEHLTCIVDLLGRSGHYDKAMALMEKVPATHHFYSWFALLGACRKSGNVNLGRLAFELV